MAKIKRIVTSEVEGRNLSDFYGDNSLAMETNGTINYYGANEMGPLIAPGVVYGANHDSGDGQGYNTIKLIPHAPGGDVYDNRYVIVDPTTPNHIHLRAGGTQDDSGVELFLGGEKTNVVVNDSNRNVKVHSRVQQQVMAHLNLNNEGNDYLLTTDVVSAVGGWTVEVNNIMYTVADVTYPTEGQTLIYAPSAPFAFQGVYNFFSPDTSNEWTFGTDGTLSGPIENGLVKVNGLWGQDVSPLYLLGPESVVIDGDGGEFLNDPTHPGNQIATLDYVDGAIPGQALETTDTATFDKVITTHNGDGTNVKIGDDAWIGDVNIANQIAIIGVSDSLEGGILLGERLGEKIYTDGENLTIEAAGAMTVEAVGGDMNFYMDGGMYIGESNSDNQIIKRSDLNLITPTQITQYSPIFAATGLTFTGSGTTYPTYNSSFVRVGNLVTFTIEVNLSTVTNFGTGQYKLQLPFTPAFGYNHFTGWANVDPALNPDVPNGHIILNVDHAGVTDVLDLHYLKQAGGANSGVIEGLFLQGTPVTLTTSSKIYINGTYIAQ